MLEHIPAWLGQALSGVRAGASKLAIVQPALAADGDPIELGSPAFANEAPLPPRFTADGAGVSPPLVWGALPADTAHLALLVEDADAPTPQPLVHAVVWLPADAGRLEEGAIAPDGTGDADGRDVGRNSYFGEGWLPPDPPTGHGVHRYAFQLFALDAGVVYPGANPGRSALLNAIEGHVLSAGLLIGTYARGEPAPTPAVQASVAPAST